MADKKRKGAAAVTEPPAKKTRQARKQDEVVAPVEASSEPADAATQAKRVQIRKRAADFMNDEHVKPTVPSEGKPAKKSKTASEPRSILKKGSKSKSSETAPVVDKTNGVTDYDNDSDAEATTESAPVTLSRAAKGSSAAVKSADSDDSDDEDPDQGAALLAGFDSDTEDVAEDKGLDLTKNARIPDHKETSKKLQAAAQKGNQGPGAVYVGRIPHGFYEKQMRDYFSQFGDITRLRLSRNRRTGASKHFAFIEFESDEVAKIVAEAMDNYLMFGHILKCKYAPAENLHPDVWKGANKKFRKIPHQKLERQQLEAPKTVKQWADKNRKEQAKRNKRAAQLKELGYEYVVPELKDPYAILEQQKKDAEAVIAAEPQKAIEGSTTVDKPATKKSKKGSKTDATHVSPLTEGNLDIQNVENAVVSGKPVENQGKSKKPAAPSSTTPVTLTTDAAKPAESSTTGSKKSRKRMRSDAAASTATAGTTGTTGTDKGDYDNLSSIPIGHDAADSVAPFVPAPLSDPQFLHKDITTEAGVADSELKKRKLERKSKSKKRKSSDDKGEEDARDARDNEEASAIVEELAPAASVANAKEGKKKKKAKAVK